MSSIKKGKVPLSSKVQPLLSQEDVFGATNSIPPAVKDEMKAKGWKPRWLNAKKIYANQGYHDRGWQIYRAPKESVPSEFKFGQDPEGVIRRGDLILGYKEEAAHDKHKLFLKQRALQASGALKNQAAELHAEAQRMGLKTEITSGYEGEDSDDDDT